MDFQKYQDKSVELEHKDHPISEEHIQTYARKLYVLISAGLM